MQSPNVFKRSYFTSKDVKYLRHRISIYKFIILLGSCFLLISIVMVLYLIYRACSNHMNTSNYRPAVKGRNDRASMVSYFISNYISRRFSGMKNSVQIFYAHCLSLSRNSMMYATHVIQLNSRPCKVSPPG